MTIKEIARAKINLCLHVVGQRADGYHLLDSVVGFAEFGDVLTFEPAEQTTLTIGGPFGDGLSGEADNLILKAARCFSGGKGAAIHLEKNLPIASGIGGGSADAAAALRGLARLWNEPLPAVAMQLALGADVPVCMDHQTVRMRGIGEDISPITDVTAKAMVLVNPNVSVSTPTIFKALQSKENPPLDPQGMDAWAWISNQRNDLQPPAIAVAPVIARVLAALEETQATLTRMSGSGATCFGVYEAEAAANDAAQQIAAQYPDWWVQTTRLTT
ncbi:4-(cytidine 5'-diphospho)-2-C-methyl-D-erythritol kinase [Amylibacter sp. IMCC11727]|uniref:4-(cytidine 5'-diphospho)-2-C-methyl-D-erythritol kinase n=1 Tax=Amylibacter sp. IMCC11727 TaxID=3039851 RepID=UPI00244DBB5C|nr:4-(cytidine 5'-diphospho)-2-C-methyl-D-erythritol kinase [Amylibacter sp. IMCC11727]WGI21651.1 4-(cytidine 5'-diphospho)-2-C-methyl-D-erythritol kinase [Amylibacter sp. IMCC11727]